MPRTFDDREFVLDRNNNSPPDMCILERAPAFQDDREVVLAAVTCRGHELEWASERLQNDKEVVLAAIKSWRKGCLRNVGMYGSGYVIAFASERLLDDYDVVLAAIKNGAYDEFYEYASQRLQNDTDLADWNEYLNNNSDTSDDDEQYIADAVGYGQSCPMRVPYL